LHADAQDALIGALSDESPDVRREAAYALAAYGRADGATFLVEDLRSGPDRPRALDALVRAGPEARDSVGTLVSDERASVGARSVGILVLAGIGTPDGLQSLLPALDANSPQVRAAAAYAIGEIGAKNALEDVRRLVHDREQRVRMFAAYASAQLGDDSWLHELAYQLKTGREAARFMAAMLLSRIRTQKAAAILVEGLGASQPGIRAIAARGLGKREFGTPEVVKALGAMSLDLNGDVRSTAAMALGAIGTLDAVRALAPFVRDAEASVKAGACMALAAAGKREGVPIVVRALDDERTEVAAAALSAMSRLTGQRFGVDSSAVPTVDDIRSAVERAHVWWIEHARQFEDR
jgi:HEAT repeat protein